MIPSQRRFTVFAAMCTVGLLVFFLYEARRRVIDWPTGLVFAAVVVLIGGFKYAYWMMRLGEWEQKKVRKRQGQDPA